MSAKRVTVLDGYYASGDYECFCFDRCDGPSAHEEKWHLHPEGRTLDEDLKATEREMDSDCRVYPDDLLPEVGLPGFGRWTITVEFEPAASSGATQGTGTGET